MNLSNLYIIHYTGEGEFRPTAITNSPFYGDPKYICEEASPQIVSKICRENPRLRIIRR
jgi:hypothetical protein